MIFKNKPLIDSEVMKEFEKIAVSKGLAKAEVMSKTASDESVNLVPGANLIIDMLNLAEGMRNKGFVKDAEVLEQKVLAYKTAETHLYRAIDEDAEDMLEFAHPKKNRLKFDAKDGHGEFEDTRTQHEKMVAIVNKKVASECDAVLEKTAEILGLKKKADFNSLDPLDAKIADVNFHKAELIKILNKKPCFYFATRDSILNGTDDVLFFGSGGFGFPLIDDGKEAYEVSGVPFLAAFLEYFKTKSKPVIGPDTWKLFLSGGVKFEDLITDEKINNANGMLSSLYGDFTNKVHSLPEIKKENGVVSVDSVNKFLEIVNGLFDAKSEVILLALIGDDEKLEAEIKNKIIPTMISGAKALLESAPKNVVTGMDEILDAGWVNVIAGRFDSAFESATNAKDSQPEYFKHVADIIRANVNKPYKEAYNQLVQFDKDLASATDKNKLDTWGQEWQKHFSKKASKKASKSSEIIKEARPLPTENAPTQPASFSRPVSNQVQHKSVSTFQQSNPEEYDAVSKMQTAIHTLAESLTQLFPKEDPKTLTEWASELTSTGYGVKGPKAEPIDGEWGPGTEKALTVAQLILEKLGSQIKLFTPAQRIKGQAQQDPKEIINSAMANVNDIYKTLNDHKVEYKGKASIPVNDENSLYVDSLPADTNIFGAITTNEDPKSGLALSKDDLNSFYNLFKFLKIHGLTEDQGFTPGDWEKIVLWFFGRSNKQFIETKAKSKGIYQELVKRLYGTLEDYAQANPDSKDKIVSAKELDGQKASEKSNSPTQNATYNSNAEGVDEQGNVEKYYPAPFGYKFDLTNLHEIYGSVMNSYEQYSYLLNDVTFDVQDFGYDPASIATTYIKLPVDSILKLNHLNPNDTVPNLKIQNKSITYEQLMTYFSAVPYVVNIKAKAYDQALYQVCSGLLNDLSNVMAYWKRNTKHTQQSSDIIDAAWKKWSDTLRRTLGRINQDISSNAPPPALQGSY